MLQLAAERGLAEAYSHAMFAAFFQDDRDVGREEVIIDVAASVGLARSDVEAALTSRQRADRHADDLTYAVRQVGVQAVPSFLIGDRLLSGVHDATQLKAAVDEFARTAAIS